MSSDNRDLVRGIFEQALQRPPEERPAYLNDACDDDAALRGEVESLLDHHHGAATGFLDTPGKRPELKNATVLGDRYELLDRLGGGGAAEVRRAWDRNLEGYVAIKMMDRGVVTEQTALREAPYVSSIDHDNVVRVLGVDLSSDGRAYVVMELCGDRAPRAGKSPRDRNWIDVGQSLDQAFAGRPLGTRDPWEIAGIMIQICRGVAAAHALGRVHGDLKPRDVLITSSGKAMVTNFGQGLSIRESEGSDDTSLGRTVAHRHPGRASDVWGLGGILLFLMTGHLSQKTSGRYSEVPVVDGFELATHAKVNADVARENQPQKLLEICCRALAPDPAQCFPSVVDMQADLQAFLDHPGRRRVAEVVIARKRMGTLFKLLLVGITLDLLVQPILVARGLDPSDVLGGGVLLAVTPMFEGLVILFALYWMGKVLHRFGLDIVVVVLSCVAVAAAINIISYALGFGLGLVSRITVGELYYNLFAIAADVVGQLVLLTYMILLLRFTSSAIRRAGGNYASSHRADAELPAHLADPQDQRRVRVAWWGLGLGVAAPTVAVISMMIGMGSAARALEAVTMLTFWGSLVPLGIGIALMLHASGHHRVTVAIAGMLVILVPIAPLLWVYAVARVILFLGRDQLATDENNARYSMNDRPDPEFPTQEAAAPSPAGVGDD